jgi:hypothetical protein
MVELSLASTHRRGRAGTSAGITTSSVSPRATAGELDKEIEPSGIVGMPEGCRLSLSLPC